MRLRKYLKTVLSAMLAAAMVVTSVPANTAYAATIQTTEETAAAEEETIQQPVTETIVVNDGEDSETTIVSPVVEGRKVTFTYDGSGYTKDGESVEVTSVALAGSMNNWNSSTDLMTKNEEGYWTITKESLEPDTYNYKFVVNGSDWIVDPKNELCLDDGSGNQNSIFYIAGLKDTDTSVVLNEETVLEERLEAVTSTGGTEEKTVTYSLLTETSGVTLGTNADNKQTITVTDESATGFKLIATDTEDAANTCTVTVNVLAKSYTEDPSLVSPVVGKGQATFYYFAPTAKLVQIKGQMTGSDWPTVDMTFDKETGYWSITLTMAVGTYEYGFEVDGDWATDRLNPPPSGSNNSVVTITEAAGEKSPVIEGNKVTFLYKDDTAETVSVAGEMNSWTANKDFMTKNTESGYWELAMENMAPGSYQYKFVVGENGWINDPLNSNTIDTPDGPNNIFWIAGLANAEVEVTRDGKAATLPTALKLYTEDGTTTDEAVTYSLSTETAAAAYADKIVLGTDAATVSIKDGFPEDVTSFTLTATDAKSNTSTVTVNVVDAKYTYTIYYYDEKHNTTDTAALWIWQTDGPGATAPIYFTGTEVLGDGKTWLKADVELSYTDVSIIPRSYTDDWAWQDSTRTYSNKEKAENTTLYIVYEDGSAIYTELPEIKAAEKRYLVVEYTRNDGSAKDWYFYTWNSGYGNNVFVPFEEVNGTWTAVIPVKQGVESVSYCMESATTAEDGTVSHWAEKDGNDYLCPVPADQTVVKICMEEGKGITKTYPYNTGYEILPKENKITFYYRDDEVFAAGSTGGYASAQIEINGTAYAMNYNADEQRYTYDMENLEATTYKYRYILKEKDDSEAKYVIDKFNEEKVTENGAEYSVCKYEAYAVEVEAQFANTSMDYNDNNVLSVIFKGEDGKAVEGMEAVSVTADLTALGGGVTEMDTALLALSVAVKEGTTAGEKTIPVTVYDQYNNEYTTNAYVTVADRNKGTDFDWDEAVIYFTVTDRFFDGDSSNNGTAANGYLVGENDNLSFHGGDFAGLTQKLDYLQDLGVNTIWITPIVENAMDAGLTTEDANGKLTDILSWGYHGYWASSFEKLDSHLGTEEQFKALLDAAHARGMKIMVDVVLNHSGYGNEDYFNNILKDEEGNSIPVIRTDAQVVSGSDQQYSLSGLPDFLTENAEVRDLLVEWQSNWVSKYDIDYYRVDTVKHVDDTTWSAFKNALTLIDPDFKMIGEWAGAGYATDTGMLRTGRMDSLLDFDFNDQALSFVTGSISATESFLTARNSAIDNTATLGAFLGSHDEDGFEYRLVNEKGVAADKTEDLLKVAASLQITAKGQVVIYYGEEIGMTGANNYPYQDNRYDFDWTLVNAENSTLKHYKKMLDIREKYSEIFAKGTRNTILADDEKGLDIFAKNYNGATVYTALNIKETAAEYTFEGLTANSVLKDVYSGTSYPVDSNGKVTVTIPAVADGGTAVFVKSDYYENNFWVESVADQTYTGKAIKLSEAQLKVYYGMTELKAGKDYTVKYKNNKAVGTATVTITGKGNYAEKETVTFNIVPKSLTDSDVSIQCEENLIQKNKVQKPLSKITYNGSKLGKKDYKAEYFLLDENGARVGGEEAEVLQGVKEAGTYELVITGLYDAEKNTGNYTGVVTKTITVFETGTYMNKTNVTLTGLTKNSTPYTGEAIEPAVEVTLKNAEKTVLTGCKEGEVNENAVYTVSYENNVNVGTAKVTVTGIPSKGYFGSVTKTFKITGLKLSSAAEIDLTNWQTSVAYDVKKGKAVQPVNTNGTNKVVLKLKTAADGETIKEGKDYTVSYLKNDKPGTATMVFTGIGKYTGTITKKFTVTKVELSVNDAKVKYTVADTAAYAKKGAKAAVTVKYDGVKLVEGKDYKLTYKNNKALTTEGMADSRKPQVTITGIGAFTGKILNINSRDEVKDTTFAIVKADLSSMKMTASDVVYKDKKGAFIVKPVLTDANGTKLSLNRDYTVKYYLVTAEGDVEKTKDDIVELDKETGYAAIKVVATAVPNSSYVEESTQTATYRVVQASIAKAGVKIDAQVYTGKAITLSKEDFTKMKVGNADLVLGEDFEIVAGSYSNNINKGTASVTVRGIGNYGGTKKVTFKITSRTMAWWWNLLP